MGNLLGGWLNIRALKDAGGLTSNCKKNLESLLRSGVGVLHSDLACDKVVITRVRDTRNRHFESMLRCGNDKDASLL